MKKKLIYRRVIATLTVLFLILTPIFNDMANTVREVNGYGGECFAFLLPMLFLGLYETAVHFDD